MLHDTLQYTATPCNTLQHPATHTFNMQLDEGGVARETVERKLEWEGGREREQENRREGGRNSERERERERERESEKEREKERERERERERKIERSKVEELEKALGIALNDYVCMRQRSEKSVVQAQVLCVLQCVAVCCGVL